MGTIVAEDLTERKFEDWLTSARPGSRLEYYRGDLAYDRENVVQLETRVAHVYFEPLHSLALAVRRAYEKGKVDLVQKRESVGVYRYYAIKRKPKEKSK